MVLWVSIGKTKQELKTIIPEHKSKVRPVRPLYRDLSVWFVTIYSQSLPPSGLIQPCQGTNRLYEGFRTKYNFQSDCSYSEKIFGVLCLVSPSLSAEKVQHIFIWELIVLETDDLRSTASPPSWPSATNQDPLQLSATYLVWVFPGQHCYLFSSYFNVACFSGMLTCSDSPSKRWMKRAQRGPDRRRFCLLRAAVPRSSGW